MAKRNFPDWLTAFCDYASFGEAPRRMYFWAGVSAVAGALRRRVWIDQAYFQWYPNFYIILVAPPGIVAKSTTADVSMSLLRDVPDIKFGPSVVTWQSLVKTFAECAEGVQVGMTYHQMSCLTIVSSEFGNLLNPQDRDMVDMLVNLWDGKPFTKQTKMSGTDEVINPWINIIACTTPEWIAGSFPEYMIGGGFTSRCIFVYADHKEKYVAYPSLEVPKSMAADAKRLTEDLQQISQLFGEMRLTPGAIEWGKKWYKVHYEEHAAKFDKTRFGGYVARKQTHMHKLAMVLSASQRDDLTITEHELALAYSMVSDLENEMSMVFAKIGQKDEARHVGRLVDRMKGEGGRIKYSEAYRQLSFHIPFATDIERAIETLIRSGECTLQQLGSTMWLVLTAASEAAAEPGKPAAPPGAGTSPHAAASSPPASAESSPAAPDSAAWLASLGR